jgi:hypothetical protein
VPPEPPWWKLLFSYLSREVRAYYDWEDAQILGACREPAITVPAREVPDCPLKDWSVAQWMTWLGHPDKAGSFDGWVWDQELKTIVFMAQNLQIVCPQLVIESCQFGRFEGDFEGPASFLRLKTNG